MGVERPLYLEVGMNELLISLDNSDVLCDLTILQSREIEKLDAIISWYETFTGIMRDEIDTIKIEGTDWEALIQAHRNDFKAFGEGKND